LAFTPILCSSIPDRILSRLKEAEMGIMHIVWSVLVGFVVGLVARAIVPGADHIGFIATAVLGIVGSLVGGFLGSVISKPKEGAAFHPAGFFLSVIGAIITLVVWHHLQ
jgi:uncharacterized membrane protein YeaQ/YmgE (transglycosylase-associated protein family)